MGDVNFGDDHRKVEPRSYIAVLALAALRVFTEVNAVRCVAGSLVVRDPSQPGVIDRQYALFLSADEYVVHEAVVFDYHSGVEHAAGVRSGAN